MKKVTMRKTTLSIAMLLSLTGCLGGKSQNIVTLTNAIYADQEYKEKIVLSKPKRVLEGNIDLNNIHLSNQDISDKPKFSKIKVPHNISAEPLVIGNRIYVLCSNGSLFAFDKNTHKELWKTYISDKRVKTQYQGGGIAFDKGKLYVTNGSQNLAVLNAENGRRYTVRSFNDILNYPPIVYKNRIFVLTLGNQLHALDKENFNLVWDHAGASESITYGESKSYIKLVPQHGLFVSYPSGQSFMLNTEDGSKIWDLHFAVDKAGSKYFPANIVVKPIFDGNHLYIADAVGKLHKFNLKDNSKIWEVKVSDIQSLNKSGNALFITTNRRQVGAISAKNGKVLWVTDLVKDVAEHMKSTEKAEKEMANQELEKEKKPADIGFIARFKRKFLDNGDDNKDRISNRKPALSYEYDVTKQKPLRVMKSYILNGQLVIYTERSGVYSIEPKDGTLVSQKFLKRKYSYMTMGDPIIFSYKDKLFYEK